MSVKHHLKPPVIFLTQQGIDEARTEHERLEKYREEVLIRLQLAREMGDLSENGAYKAARSELGDTDRRLRKLKYLLRFGQVPTVASGGVVGFGSTVSINHNGQVSTFQIVSEHESDPIQKKLSDTSPIGSALMGKRVGDTVVVNAPAGPMTYVIESIE